MIHRRNRPRLSKTYVRWAPVPRALEVPVGFGRIEMSITVPKLAVNRKGYIVSDLNDLPKTGGRV